MMADKKDGLNGPASPTYGTKNPEGRGPDKTAAPGSKKQIQARDPIDEGLRRLFQDVIEEPIPAEFLELLEKIDEKARAKSDPA